MINKLNILTEWSICTHAMVQETGPGGGGWGKQGGVCCTLNSQQEEINIA